MGEGLATVRVASIYRDQKLDGTEPFAYRVFEDADDNRQTLQANGPHIWNIPPSYGAIREGVVSG